MRSSSTLSSIFAPQSFVPDAAYVAMCSARQSYHVALDNWLVTGPDPDLAREEIRGGINVARALARLRGIALR